MNTYTIFLSSPSTSYTYNHSEINLNDHTQLTLDLSNMSEKFLPIFMKIDWGDGSYNTYDNDVFVKSRDKINIFKISPILTNTYIKEYYPSDSALYKNLTAQILIEYSNGDHTWVTIPINIRSYDYFESIYDLNIVNTNILPVSSNSLAYQLKTSEGGFIIELSN